MPAPAVRVPLAEVMEMGALAVGFDVCSLVPASVTLQFAAYSVAQRPALVFAAAFIVAASGVAA